MLTIFEILTAARNSILPIVTLFIAVTSPLVLGSEYEEDDIEPIIKKLLFSKTHIGLISENYYVTSKEEEKNIYFLLNRKHKKGKEVSTNEFVRIFGNKAIGKLPISYHKKTFTVSDGTVYELVPDGDCKFEEIVKDSEVVDYKKVNSKGLSIQQLKQNGKIIDTEVKACVGEITALEHADGNLWIGTGDLYEKGMNSGQGVFVQRWDNGKHVKSHIKMENLTSAIKRDPYTGAVWIVASYALHVMENNGDRINKYRFYHDFDHDTGLPRIYISKDPVLTNPFSLVARYMTKKNRRAFYDEAKNIHKDLWPSFNLYFFYMCCSIDQQIYPASFNTLAPVLIKELEETVVEDNTTQHGFSTQKRHYKFWLQTLCRFDGPSVLEYLKSRKDPSSESADYEKIDTYIDSIVAMERKRKKNTILAIDKTINSCIDKLEKAIR